MSQTERDRGYRRQMAERDRKRNHQPSQAGGKMRHQRTCEQALEADDQIHSIIGADNA